MKRLLFITLVLVVIGGGAYWFFTRSTTWSLSPGSQSTSTTDAVDTADFAPYSDPNFHFSLAYPKDLEVHVYDEDDGSRTVAFEGQTPGIGFQVFVVPYDKPSIDDARFRADDPSGVMIEPQDISIGGVPAKIFYGHNDQMGDTREVWFIRNGYLYEVTGYKALDTWLADIMTTWKFI